MVERFKTKPCIRNAGSESKEGISPLSCVSARIASVWWWINRLRIWQKPKADQRDRDGKQTVNRIS